MSPSVQKSVNLFATILFVLGGIFCFGLTAYFAITPAAPKPAKFISATPDIDGCQIALTQLGFKVEHKNVNLIINTLNIEKDPQATVEKASIGIALCHMSLKKFCMGESCLVTDQPGAQKQKGLQFILDATVLK